jgi:hypothetical protein
MQSKCTFSQPLFLLKPRTPSRSAHTTTTTADIHNNKNTNQNPFEGRSQAALFTEFQATLSRDPNTIAELVRALSPAQQAVLQDALKMECTMHNIRTSAVDDETIQSTFSMIDSDKSGFISRSEFAAYFSKHTPPMLSATEPADEEDISKPVIPPSTRDLSLFSLSQSIPFVAFGFIDNSLMIVFGEAIDMKLGVFLGCSTMACAGLGNAVSDVAGVMLGGAVHAFSSRLGIPTPPLTRRQLQMTRTRVVATISAGVGIAIGCLLGMAPLLFVNRGESERERK